ncbi:PAS domain S-box protein [Massilia sp. W12]|uniref:PAS domain S-box protein n=1 Tax=Massilia sp. W12 TaxID=3126507 RepID=UPI0030CF0930
MFSHFWRERCNDAFDNMRDDLAGGRATGLALQEQGRSCRDVVMQQAGHLVLAFAALRSGHTAQAQKLLQQLQPALHPDIPNRLLFHTIQALIYSTQGLYREAWEYGQGQLIPLLSQYQGRENLRALLSLGVFAVEYNQAEEAMRHYFSALDLLRKLRLPARWRAHINANLGEILCNSGNPEDAEAMLQEAMTIAHNEPERFWLQTYVSTIYAMCQLALGKYQEAYQALLPQLRALERELEADSQARISQSVLCLCIAVWLLSEQNQLNEAKRLFDLLQSRSGQIEEQQHQAYLCWVRGHLLHKQGDLLEAAKSLQQAVAVLGNVEFDFMALRVRQELSDIFGKLGDWQQALQEYQNYHALYERAQGRASRMHIQVLHIQSELREAENARRMAEQTMAERKELADSLRQSLAERDTILQNSMVGIAFLDGDACLHWANLAFATIFGLNPVDAIGHTLQKYFIEAPDYARMLDTALLSRSGKGGFEAECRMRRADGSQIWVWLSGRAVRADQTHSGTVWVAMDITRRHQLEQELNRSETQHRLVVDNAVEGIVMLQAGRIMFANPSILQMANLTRKEVIGAEFLQFVHEEDRERVLRHHQNRMAGQMVDRYITYRTSALAGQQLRWVESSAVAIEWEGSLASVVFVNDITERKRLEDNLRASLAERETILEHSLVGIAFLNAQGRVKWANHAMLQIFGGRLEQYLGTSLEPMYPSREAYLETGAMAAQAVRRGEAFSTELQMRRGNGELFWASLSGRAVHTTDLEQGTVWAVLDIDRRRKLEAELAKSEEHHRAVVDNVTEGIMVVQEGRIVFANPRVQQISGRSQQELFSMPVFADVHPDDLEMVKTQYEKRLRNEPAEKYFAFRIRNHQSGEISWIEISAVPIEWEGKPASLSFLNDITNRRNLEESLRQSHAERVHLQTLQFQHELREAEMARRHAEETTRAKSMFLANMSHEIRTPMNAIIGMAHLALCTELSPKQRDYLEKIHSAGISLLGIINDILDFSRIEAGKLLIERVEFNLDKVLSNLSTVTSDKAREKELQYVFQIPARVPRTLIGDPLRLGQVLINLVNNAIKFTESGGVYLNCQVREMVEGQRVLLEFNVRDTGIGMQPDQVAKLFHAFSQADESTTRKYGGTGLGLSIAKGMVELMDGRIWLESTPGVGTNMHFTAWFGLPAMQAQSHHLPGAVDGMRVLVVDDNPGARLALAEILSHLPVEVDFAFGGGEALAAIRACDENWPYGLIFITHEMPGVSGLKLAHDIQHAEIKHKPKLILLSDQARETLQQQGDITIPDALLHKPVQAADVNDCLVDLFDASQHTPHQRQETPMFAELTVLLVEDNEINQMIATELMQAVGIKVEVAANGRLAVETLQKLGPDYFGLVFMDVQMPEMDGHQATRAIRSDARFANLPVIAMTAHAMVEERERCLESGMNDHIAKPINPGEFYHMLSSWCSQYLAAGNAQPLLDLHEIVHLGAAPQTESAPAAPDAPLQIPGIDVADGLSRMLGDQAMYLELLSRFRDGQHDVAAKLAHALVSDDLVLAERFAHTLKGVAGMIGAAKVKDCASVLEQACKQGAASQVLQTRLADLDGAMQEVLQGIEQALAQRPGAQETVCEGFERTQAQEAINQFARLLQQNDGDAIDFLAEHNQLLAQALGPDAHRRIMRATRQFDFDLALDALEKGAVAAEFSAPAVLD